MTNNRELGGFSTGSHPGAPGDVCFAILGADGEELAVIIFDAHRVEEVLQAIRDSHEKYLRSEYKQ